MEKDIAKIASLVLGPGVYRATKYISPDLVVKATRPHKYRKSARGNTIVLTAGKPNYREREFIAKCKKAGEPFPVKKIQLEHDK